MRDLLVSIFLSIPLIGAFAMLGLGIVVIYRASRVLNLAHGAMAMFPAYLFYSVTQAGLPTPVALPVAVIAGAAIGVGVERLFVERLRREGQTAQTVGTVAVTGLLVALAAKLWGTTPILTPGVFPSGEIRIAGAALRYGDVGLFAVGIATSLGLFAFFARTEFGLAMRGAAQNRRAASLMGIDPDRAGMAAWALGGALAGLAGVLLAAVTNLDPYNLTLGVLPAFVAALIGGLENLKGALWGAVVAGVSFGLVPIFSRTPVLESVFKFSGSAQLLLTALAIVVMVVRGRRIAGADAGDGGFGASRPFAGATNPRWLLFVAAGAILLPWVVPFSVLGDSLYAIEISLITLSLVVLIGWVGQISLAQASFVGVGALTTAMVARGAGLGFPLNVVVGMAAAAGTAVLLGVVALRVRGLYLAVATMIFAWMADQFLFRSPWLGAGQGSSTIPDQRIGLPGGVPSFDLTNRRTLYFVMLAVLIGVVAALSNASRTKIGRAFFAVRGSEMAAASLGIDVVRTKLIAFALSGALAGLGGGLIMVEQRTVVPAQFLFTLSLFYLSTAVVGGLSSLGGAIGSGIVFAALSELFFRVSALQGWLEAVSAGLLALVLLTYPGGLASAVGSAGRALARVPHALHYVSQRAGASRARGAEPTRVGVLRVLQRAAEPVQRVLSRVPIAKAAAGALGRARQGLERGAPRRPRRMAAGPPPGDWLRPVSRNGKTPVPTDAVPDRVALGPDALVEGEIQEAANGTIPIAGGGQSLSQEALVPHALPPRDERPIVLEVRGVTVRFGGLTAVSNASLEVRERDIVGLIGPNGAGKTTLFNAILGLNDPTEGRIFLHGHEATGLPPHMRARYGIARTFQVIQLFTDLSVADNLLVATHIHNSTSLLSNLAATRRTVLAELDAWERVDQVLRLLDLKEVADRPVRGLPFGVLRMVEMGRALVTGAPLLMIDEPASGLNESETDRLIEVVRGVRALGVAVLLIEHDVRMVTGVSDYIYVLDQGQMIAEGTSSVIQRHPRVIAAYLGGEPSDEEASINA